MYSIPKGEDGKIRIVPFYLSEWIRRQTGERTEKKLESLEHNDVENLKNRRKKHTLAEMQQKGLQCGQTHGMISV